jgi:hypothetical protein
MKTLAICSAAVLFLGLAACRSNPGNRSSYDLDACLSSCSDTMSGCGLKP